LLHKIRQKFEITGLISLLFGGLFTLSFYEAKVGVNVLFFTSMMIILLMVVMKQFELTLKKGTYLYYVGAMLAALSTMLTASGNLQFMNFIVILCLLNLSLLHQLHTSEGWDVLNYLSKMFGIIIWGIVSIGMPFIDGLNFLKRTKLFRNDKTRNIFVGAMISVPILWVIIILLSQADMIFGDMTEVLIERIFSSNLIFIIFMTLFGFFSCYCILCGAAIQTGRKEIERKRGAASIATTFILLITLLYILFCGLQIVYLFSNGIFTLPEDYTFAEYARRGFFELLAVAMINVALMLIVNTFFEENRFLRNLLTIMTVCTYILIGSATYRMILYIGAYHLTFLRLFVLLSLLILSLILAGVIISVYHKSFPLFRYCVAVVAGCYLTFSFAKPDYFIASYLEEHKAILSAEDAAYLTYDLSLDAAPLVLPLLADSNRWSEEAKAGTEASGSTYSEDGRMVELQSVDFYSTAYYDLINRESFDRDVRGYNLSIDKSTEYAEQYPIRYHKQ
ncbi:MAG: putative rane protein, partial [Herbinix sp.]|nr:putative rane protein [Herbinix sp.]